MKSRPAAPQACSSGFSPRRRRRPNAASSRSRSRSAERAQVAPVLARRRRQVEMQRADARLGRDHAQHVRRDVERREREQPRRQARRATARRRRRSAPGSRRCAARDARGRRRCAATAAACGSRGAVPGLPAQQPVAAPGLVLLERRRELAGQRPRLERVVAVRPGPSQVGAQRPQRRLAQQRRIGQRRVQPPAQRVGVEVLAAPGHVGVERALHEFARGEELEVGGDAVRLRQRRLQPAPHRDLRNQHHVRAPATAGPAPACAVPGRAVRPARPAHWSGRGGSRGGRASAHLAAVRSQRARFRPARVVAAPCDCCSRRRRRCRIHDCQPCGQSGQSQDEAFENGPRPRHPAAAPCDNER